MPNIQCTKINAKVTTETCATDNAYRYPDTDNALKAHRKNRHNVQASSAQALRVRMVMEPQQKQ